VGTISVNVCERVVYFWIVKNSIITFVSSGRIRSQGGDFLELLSPGEQEQKLHEYQDEMRQFAAFLKSILNTKKP